MNPSSITSPAPRPSARAPFILALSAVFILAACDNEPNPAAPREPEATATARYSVTFDATCSAATHPTDIPSKPHFSRLIGGTHGAETSFWQAGGMASEGIRSMAEEGQQTPLDTEVMAAIAAGAAEHILSGGDVPLSPGSTSLEFEISLGHPLVTLVSMVAPSPDWFVGVSRLSLLENGDWVSERVIELFPYDAGTDSGATYQSRNQVTTPREPIRLLSGPPVTGDGAVPSMGRFVFRRASAD